MRTRVRSFGHTHVFKCGSSSRPHELFSSQSRNLQSIQRYSSSQARPLEGIAICETDNRISTQRVPFPGGAFIFESVDDDASVKITENKNPLVRGLCDQGAVMLGYKNSGFKFLLDETSKTKNKGYNALKSRNDRTIEDSVGQVAIGEDIQGSLRNSAALNGLFGIKLGKNFQKHTSMSTGILTNRVDDAIRVLRAISPESSLASKTSIQDLKIVYSPTLGLEVNSDWYNPHVATKIRNAIQEFQNRSSIQVEEIQSIPGLYEDATLAQRILQAASLRSNSIFLAHYDNMMCDKSPKQVDQIYSILGSYSLNPANIQKARENKTMKESSESKKIVMGVSKSIESFLSKYDVLLTPTIADSYDSSSALTDPSPSSINPFTFPFNWSGSTAASVPVGVTSSGLPVALQIIAQPKSHDRAWSTDAVLRVAKQFESRL